MSEINTPFERIEAKRAERGWSQREACRQAGLNESALANAKRNGGAVDLSTVEAFAQAFNCRVAELLGHAAPAEAEAEATAPRAGDVILLPLRQLQASPLNPRKTFDPESIEQLADSITAQGILQNLVVRPHFGKTPDGQTWHQQSVVLPDRAPIYEIIAGERRYRALQHLSSTGRWDWKEVNVPCRILTADDAQHLALALMENLQREEVNPMEEAEGFAQLQTLDPDTYTTTAIAERLGKTGKAGQRYVQQRLALVEKLLPEAQDALREGKISFTMARQLTMAPIAHQMAAAKNLTGFKSAGEIKTFLTKDMVPVGKAFFELEGCDLEIVEDPESGERYFADKAAFIAAQKAAAKVKVAELAGEWAWAELKERFYDWEYASVDSEDRTLAGAVVMLDNYVHTVTVYLGVVKKEDTPAADTSDYEARRREEEARKKAADELCGDFATRLRAAIRDNPQTAGRVLLLLPVFAPHPDVHFSFQNYRGVHKDAVNGGCWSFLAGFVDKANDKNAQCLKPTADLAEVLKASRELSPQQAAHCTAALVASMWAPQLDWRNHKIDRFSVAMASLYDVEIPADLLPDRMDQLEDQAGDVSTPEDVAEILLEAIALHGNARWGQPAGYRAPLDMTFDALGIDMDPSPLVEKLFEISLAPVDWQNRTVAHLVAVICHEYSIGEQDEDGPLTTLAKEFADAVNSIPSRVRQVLRDALAIADDDTSLPADCEALADLGIEDAESATELAEALQGEFDLPKPPFTASADTSMEEIGLGTVGKLIAYLEKRLAPAGEIPDELDDGEGLGDDEEDAA